MTESNQEKARGLGALIEPFKQQQRLLAVSVLEKELRKKFPPDKKAKPWTLEEAIYVLKAVRETISEIMDERQYPNDEMELVLTHPATQMLGELAEILDDLRHGNVDERLKTPEGFGGAAHKVLERNFIEFCLQNVEIVKRAKNISYTAARKEVVGILRKQKRRFRGDEITETKLASWQRTWAPARRPAK